MSDTPDTDPIVPLAVDMSKLWAAVLEAQRSIDPVVKGKTAEVKTKSGASYTYKFASTEDMMMAAREALLSHGVMPQRVAYDVRKGPAGAEVWSTFRLVHPESGGVETFDPIPMPIAGTGAADKVLAGALTYAWSYWLRDVLAIPREDENEPDKRKDDTKAARYGQGHGRDDVPRGTQRRVVKDEGTDAPPKASKPRTSPNVPPSQTKAADDITNARVAMKHAMDSYNAACEEVGVAARPWTDIAAEAIGQPWDTSVGVHPISDYVVVTKAFAEAEAAARLSVGDAVDAAAEGGGE